MSRKRVQVPGICRRCPRSTVGGKKHCEVCLAKIRTSQRARYAADPALYLARNRANDRARNLREPGRSAANYRKKYRYNLFLRAKMRARQFGLPFTITEQHIVIPDVCPILGIPLRIGDGRTHAGSPSVDRIIPALGYTPGNTWVISHRANQLKNDGTAEEHEKIAAAIRERTRLRVA